MWRRGFFAFCLLFIVAVVLVNPWKGRVVGANINKVWTTTGFLGFIDGTLDDGGANTYVAADGSIRLINLWDLNHDGNVDLVFPSTHNYNEKVDLYLYWNKGGFSPDHRTQLPTDGGKAVAIADLNGDGYPDLIVANSFNGTKTELNSYIYWGSKQGFTEKNRTELPTQGANAVAVSDLNGAPNAVCRPDLPLH